MTEPLSVGTGDTAQGDDELDVRDVPKAKRHPLIFSRFAELPARGSFVLVNSHDPKHLREEFERDHPGEYDWEYLDRRPVWRIRITRRADTDLPRVLANSAALTSSDADPDASGAVWKLDIRQRHLDSNVIHLPAAGRVRAHTGPDLDVLLHVIAGSGRIETVAGEIPLTPGDLVWLPRRAQRSIIAGPDGLDYLTVHPRRPGLSIEAGR